MTSPVLQVKVWFQNRRMKWRHQENKDRRELGGNAAAAAGRASDVIMQCDVTGNDIMEVGEEEVSIEDEEADSTADREISSTKL